MVFHVDCKFDLGEKEAKSEDIYCEINKPEIQEFEA